MNIITRSWPLRRKSASSKILGHSNKMRLWLSRLGRALPQSLGSARHGSSISVILLDSVQNWGSRGEVVSVKRGFARNFLVPRKLAAYATPENKQRFESLIKSTSAVADAKATKVAESNAASASGPSAASLLPALLASMDAALAQQGPDFCLRVTRDAQSVTESGTLYAAVSAEEVAAAALSQLGVALPAGTVEAGAIKALGRAVVKCGGRDVAIEVARA